MTLNADQINGDAKIIYVTLHQESTSTHQRSLYKQQLYQYKFLLQTLPPTHLEITAKLVRQLDIRMIIPALLSMVISQKKNLNVYPSAVNTAMNSRLLVVKTQMNLNMKESMTLTHVNAILLAAKICWTLIMIANV